MLVGKNNNYGDYVNQNCQKQIDIHNYIYRHGDVDIAIGLPSSDEGALVRAIEEAK